MGDGRAGEEGGALIDIRAEYLENMRRTGGPILDATVLDGDIPPNVMRVWSRRCWGADRLRAVPHVSETGQLFALIEPDVAASPRIEYVRPVDFIPTD